MDSHWHPPFEFTADPASPSSDLLDGPGFSGSGPTVNVRHEGVTSLLVPDQQLSSAVTALEAGGVTHGLPAFEDGNLVIVPPDTFSQDQEFEK